MYAIRYSPNIDGDIARGWSAWMGMRYASFLALVNTAAEVDEYHFSEWCEARDLDADTEEAAEQYVSDFMDWDVRIDPATSEYCVVHHDGLSVFVVDEEDLDTNVAVATEWAAARWAPTGQGHATEGRVTVMAKVGNWHVLECESASPEV
jgi:hypothetical protein